MSIVNVVARSFPIMENHLDINCMKAINRSCPHILGHCSMAIYHFVVVIMYGFIMIDGGKLLRL